MRIALAILAAAVIAVALAVLIGFAPTHHPVRSVAGLGVARASRELLAVIDTPGPVVLETVNSADWAVTRDGLINLKHPKAVAAGLTDGDEPIQIYFHALHHPTQGLFIVDTGVEMALRDRPDTAAIRGFISSAMHLEKMKFHQPLGDYLAAHPNEPLQGVLLTHLHLDHVTGMADVPAGTPVYTGPGEATDRNVLNALMAPTVDRALAGKGDINEWPFHPDADHRFEGVVDVFGDGSVWAIWVPGHTAGTTAYLVRTTEGPVLLTGDACHTRWGWDNEVEPGSFTADAPRGVASLGRLHTLVKEHPAINVRLGHQR
ncbi:MBL fold hydrolase [Corallococcus sp. H22C18031201]|nr:MBL fold hydrolase [Corallococcus sp. H22C18031201]